jgi:hypothetical protein
VLTLKTVPSVTDEDCPDSKNGAFSNR